MLDDLTTQYVSLVFDPLGSQFWNHDLHKSFKYEMCVE